MVTIRPQTDNMQSVGRGHTDSMHSDERKQNIMQSDGRQQADNIQLTERHVDREITFSQIEANKPTLLLLLLLITYCKNNT